MTGADQTATEVAAQRTVLVTGYPLDVAKRMTKELVRTGSQVLVLARTKFAPEAAAFAEQATADLGRASGGRAEALQGDILELDLGLSGETVRRLHAEVHEVHHIAAVRYLGIDAPQMRRVNIEGLREMLEVCLGMRQLQRVCVWSTAFVAGSRSGVVRETDLLVGQTFRNAYERSKAQAEQLARAAMTRLPITIVRPSIIVGDSETGEVTSFDGPYPFIKAIVHAPGNVAVPLPGRGRYPFHVVPIDFAVQAALHLTRHPQALGGTFHVVDDAPLSARELFDAVADAAGKPRPSGFLPGGVVHAILGLPGLRNYVRTERSFVEWFDADVHFDNRNARALLHPSDIRCPPVPRYVDALVRFVREKT